MAKLPSEDRRSAMGTTAGLSYEMLTAFAPRLSDALLNRQHRSQPDSAAARGAVRRGSDPSP